MIKINELKEVRPVAKYINASEVSLDVLEEIFEVGIDAKGLSVAIDRDIVKDGLKKEECLVLYNPEEKGYEKVCIRVKKQGTYAFVYVNSFGTSKALLKDRMIKGGLNGMMSANVAGLVVGAVVGKKILNMSKRSKVEEEMYYECLMTLINEILAEGTE